MHRRTKTEYAFAIRPLAGHEGGGYLIEFPDLPGCYSDGPTIAQAIANGKDAVKAWIATAKEFGDSVPAPGAHFSGQWRQRVPRSLHAKLAARARRDGVSLNALVTALLAEGLGRRDGKEAL